MGKRVIENLTIPKQFSNSDPTHPRKDLGEGTLPSHALISEQISFGFQLDNFCCYWIFSRIDMEGSQAVCLLAYRPAIALLICCVDGYGGHHPSPPMCARMPTEV